MVILLSLENHRFLEPSFGNPAVRPHDLTRGFASPPRDGFAIIGKGVSCVASAKGCKAGAAGPKLTRGTTAVRSFGRFEARCSCVRGNDAR